jgi:hypothetical protein
MTDMSNNNFNFKLDDNIVRELSKSLTPPRTNALMNPQTLKKEMRYVDMAHAMYIEGQNYDTPEERFRQLFEKYEELFNMRPGLFLAARDQTLYNGENGRRLRAFQDGHGDPKKIIENMENIIKEDIETAKQKYAEYMKSCEEIQKQQNDVNSVIEKYREMNNKK